jgi:hypothetical protein
MFFPGADVVLFAGFLRNAPGLYEQAMLAEISNDQKAFNACMPGLLRAGYKFKVRTGSKRWRARKNRK